MTRIIKGDIFAATQKARGIKSPVDSRIGFAIFGNYSTHEDNPARTDWLACSSCGRIVWPTVRKNGIIENYGRPVWQAYNDHFKTCSGLRRYRVLHRRQKAVEALIARYIDPLIETLSKEFC